MDYNLDSIYEGLYEYYVNDYIIFEGILRRDYYEVTGILNENAVTNFLKGIWEKILKAFKWLRDKIKELINKIFKKGNKEDSDSEEETIIIKGKKMTIKEMIKKFNSYSDEDKEKLKELKVSGFRAKNINNNHLIINSNEKVKKTNSIYIEFINDIEECFQYYNNINNIYSIKKIKAELDKSTSKILNKDISKEIKDFNQNLYDYFFEKEDIEYPFKNGKIFFGDSIENMDYNYIPDTLKDFQKILKNVEKGIQDIQKNIDNGNITGYTVFNDTKIDEKTKQDINKQLQKGLSNILKAINISSKAVLSNYSILFKYIKMYRKQYIRLLRTAINYLENNNFTNESYISNEYINTLSEATIYELDLEVI